MKLNVKVSLALLLAVLFVVAPAVSQTQPAAEQEVRALCARGWMLAADRPTCERDCRAIGPARRLTRPNCQS